MRPPVDTSTYEPVAWRAVLPAVAALAVALTLVSNRYGYHRDELYFRMLPPAWGYVDQPPLTPAIARALARTLDEPAALRLPATVFAVASVVVVALLAREVGGDPFAQALAAWGYGFGTFTLTFGHLLLTASLDLLVWPLVVLAVVRALHRAEPRWWLLAGATIGLSTYNKWLIVLLVASLVAGLLVAGPRRVLLSPWVLGSAALAVLLAVPNLVWQATHGAPQVAIGRALAERNATSVRIATVPMLVVMIGPLLFCCLVAGFVYCLRRPTGRPLRFLAVALVVMVGLTMLGGSQFYYPYGLVAAVFAVGCVPVARFARRSRGRLMLVVALAVLHVVTNTVISLPVLPISLLAKTFLPSLNQTVGDSIGWPRYVTQIDAVTEQAMRTDPRTVVLASNYGEAGALSRFGRYATVPLVSGHNALWGLGGPAADTRTVVVVGGQLKDVAGDFARCEVRARLSSGTGVDNEEEGQPVAICTGPSRSWAELWPTMRHLG